MIELRWLVRPGWDGPERILQVRQKVDINIYAGAPFPGTTFTPNLQWSEWKDIPEVKE
jgi:hypothetical protein